MDSLGQRDYNADKDYLLEELGFGTIKARNAVTSLMRNPVEAVAVTPTILLDTYEVSAEKNHNVYDCFYVALAREADSDRLVTTDRDFEPLRADEPFEFVNLVPDGVLSEFHSVEG